jgi:hypothetical protein
MTYKNGAEEETRTLTPVRELDPEGSITKITKLL